MKTRQSSIALIVRALRSLLYHVESQRAIALIVRALRSALSNFYYPHMTKQLQVHIAELKFHLLSK